MGRPAKIHLDLTALKHNLQIVRQLAPSSKIAAIIKANAYGHGIDIIAPALNGQPDVSFPRKRESILSNSGTVKMDSRFRGNDTELSESLNATNLHSTPDLLGVACIEEALLIRQAGVSTDILLLEGFFTADEIPLLVQQNFATVIHCFRQIELLEKTPLSTSINVWLKIDTGMHRLGFAPEALSEAWQRLQQCPWVTQPPLLMSHFANADNIAHPMTLSQLAEFKHFAQPYSSPKSLANSAGILAWPESHYDWVRPGIMLYGVSPFANVTGKDHHLKPVMTLSSELIAIRQCKSGESVGYGATWTCPEEMSIGTVAIGYGDGYPRHAKSGTPVLVNNQIVPLVGRVSMDMITVDLRLCPHAKIGDEVILWGEGLPVEHVAAMADTIGYELLCNITDRVR